MTQSPSYQGIAYELISSPMLLNGYINKTVASPYNIIKKSIPGIPTSELDIRPNSCKEDKRGYSRTATTLLDQSQPSDEANRLIEAAKVIEKRERELLSSATAGSSETTEETSTKQLDKVSIYSGPLHNSRPINGMSASMADKLANARMMSKSGYTWDQAGSCAKIRLGDGAILQNLYPSHSHVKLRNGKIERIDVYTQRFLRNDNLLREVTLIKDYEYNQWARTKPLNGKETNSKAIPLDKIESRSTQPSWDTVRLMNGTTSLSIKNRLFSYDDLTTKFSQPKFLKRMGFIENETDYNPIETVVTKQGIKTSVAGNAAAPKTSNLTNNGLESSCKKDKVEVTDSEDLSSDDEEYHLNRAEPTLPPERVSESTLPPERVSESAVPPERVPSSRRSARQQLTIYNDDGVIGSQSITTRLQSEAKLMQSENFKVSENMDSTENGKITAQAIDSRHSITSTVNDTKIMAAHNQAKSLRRLQPYKLTTTPGSDIERKFVRFSQPVCLCPKLSKETLSSFYSSPMMERYFRSSQVTSGDSKNTKCQLHDSTKNSSHSVLSSM